MVMGAIICRQADTCNDRRVPLVTSCFSQPGRPNSQRPDPQHEPRGGQPQDQRGPMQQGGDVGDDSGGADDVVGAGDDTDDAFIQREWKMERI